MAEIEEKIIEILKDFTQVKEITLRSNLKDDLGIDSLDFYNLILELENEFDIEIPDEDARKLTIVNDLILYCTAKVEGK